MKADKIENEEVRLALLRGYNILDTAPENDFDEIVDLVTEVCEVPIALVSLVEDDRQWFKASVGMDAPGTPIEQSVCAHALHSDGFLEIPDTTLDPRTADNTLVTGPDRMRFYAGAVLKGDNGMPVGTLCVLDKRPRTLTALQVKTLKILANQVMRQIEFRKALAATEILSKEVDHRVKNSLQSLEALIRLQTRSEKSPEAREALEAVQGRLAMISKLHEALYLTDAGAVVGLHSFIEKVAHATSGQMPQGVRVRTDLDRFDLESRDASSVGMIVNEAMMNASKYAYQGREGGTFNLIGRRDDETYTLICRDDGPGSQKDAVEGTGLGQKIMEAAALQLNGTMTVAHDGKGFAVTLIWPT